MVIATETGRIAADSMYTLTALKEFGFGPSALREARRRGLKVRKVGKRGFVIGRDLIEFVEQTGKPMNPCA